jgi:hypothetical protein
MERYTEEIYRTRDERQNGGKVVRHIEVRDALLFFLYFLVQVELVWLRPFRNATRQQKKYHVSPKLPE